MSTSPQAAKPAETFDEFYARTFAYRAIELERCTDGKVRAELEAYHQESKEQMRGWWEKARADRARFQSNVTDEEQEEQRREYGCPPNRLGPSLEHPNSTYRVIKGEAA